MTLTCSVNVVLPVNKTNIVHRNRMVCYNHYQYLSNALIVYLWILLLTYLLVTVLMLFLVLLIVLASIVCLYLSLLTMMLSRLQMYYLTNGYVNLECHVLLLVTVILSLHLCFGLY